VSAGRAVEGPGRSERLNTQPIGWNTFGFSRPNNFFIVVEQQGGDAAGAHVITAVSARIRFWLNNQLNFCHLCSFINVQFGPSGSNPARTSRQKTRIPEKKMPSPKGCPQIGVVLPRLLLVSRDFDQIPIFLLPPSSNALPPHGRKHFSSKQRCKLVPTQNPLFDFTELQRQYVAQQFLLWFPGRKAPICWTSPLSCTTADIV
jgi:hypothetical protein